MHSNRATDLQVLQQGVDVRGGVVEQLPGLLDPGLDHAQVLLQLLPLPQLLAGLGAPNPGLGQQAGDAQKHIRSHLVLEMIFPFVFDLNKGH